MKSINIEQALKKVEMLAKSDAKRALVAYSKLISLAQETGKYNVQTDCLLASAKINNISDDLKTFKSFING